jgi:hypothetical protein
VGMTSNPYIKSFMNDGSGHFNTKQSFGNAWVNSLDLGDLNNDRMLDVFFVSGDCSNQPSPAPGQIWLNDDAGIFFDSKLRSGNMLSADLMGIKSLMLLRSTGAGMPLPTNNPAVRRNIVNYISNNRR